MGATLRLEFDRSNRTYRAGEPARGVVRIETSGSARCRAVWLRPFWETHGPGNVDQGGGPPIDLLEKQPLPRASDATLPFEFPAPLEPLTYQGRALAVNHYVEVDAHVEGAPDASLVEDFVVIPGPLVGPPPRGLERRHISWEDILASGRRPTDPLKTALGKLPSILKRQMAEVRLGSVSARLNTHAVVPGDTLTVQVRVEPKSAIAVNGATLELRALEVCVSGTGEERRTERYEVYSKLTPIPVGTQLSPTEISTFTASVTIPDRGLYTFVLKENALIWEAVVRVDIPLWPDWEKTFPLLVWPLEGVQEPTAPEPEAGKEVGPESEGVPQPEPAPDSEARRRKEPPAPPEVAAQPHVVEESEPPADAESAHEPVAVGAPEIADLVQAIRLASPIGGERDQLIQELLNQKVSFDLTVKRVDRTFGMYSDPAYHKGRTVDGLISGTDLDVRISLPDVLNEMADGLKAGSTCTVAGNVAELDRLNLRPIIRADVLELGEA